MCRKECLAERQLGAVLEPLGFAACALYRGAGDQIGAVNPDEAASLEQLGGLAHGQPQGDDPAVEV